MTIHTGAASTIVIKGLAFTKGPKGWVVACKKGAPKPTPSEVLDAALDEIQFLRSSILKAAAKMKAH